MRIAVIGAGVGGLVFAAGTQADGHEVTVFERRRSSDPAGAGLTLFGNAFAALDILGLGDAVRDVSSSTIATMRAGQRTPSGAWLTTLPPSAVASMRSIHRAQLHRALIDQLAPTTVRTGRTATVPSDGSPRVAAGGEFEEFDLVVAADGIRSRTRTGLGLDTGLRYAGCTAWRGITAEPVDIREEAGETWGRGRIFGVVPLRDGRIYWFATANAPAGTRFEDEHGTVLRLFEDWHDPIPACVRATPAGAVIRHDLHDLAEPLPSFVRGRTALLGDAAHAMTPNLGQGAGQAIEDAATLAVLLRGCGEGGLDTALADYSRLRRQRTRAIARRSRMAGRVAQAEGRLSASLRDAALRLTPGAVLSGLSRRMQDWAAPTPSRLAPAHHPGDAVV
ncbi:FAD-dependent monooxygenase [Microbacterium soli]|uniref:FAD-dependent monooxygenase n=2 Tax=Microbacterium soli TaxID=446075 RepID=A0ABP7NIB8_9MICO